MRAPLENSTILITGASSGIGAAFARELAAEAKALILVARREDRLAALKRELDGKFKKLKVEVVACDITRHDDVDRMLAQVQAKFGNVEILINNAGMGDIKFFENTTWPKLQQMIDLNVTALVYLTKKVSESMIRNRRGGILMVGSTAGYQVLPGFTTYSATKFFVRGFSDGLRAELKAYGVPVTNLCPGPVATEFMGVAVDQKKIELAPPPLSEISAEHCARAAIRGFRSGKAVVIPGVTIKFSMFFQMLTPAPILRAVMSLLAKPMRKKIAISS